MCREQFGHIHWGNWLHSPTFSIGALLILLAMSIAIGSLTGNPIWGIVALGTLLITYLFLFWTFPGWLILYKFVHWAFIPGPTPAGM